MIALWVLLEVHAASIGAVARVEADTQPWHPALVRLFAAAATDLPLRGDVELQTHHAAAVRLDLPAAVPGPLLTARHVVAGARRVRVDGAPARVVWEDAARDLALLRREGPEAPAWALGPVPPPGASIQALGYGGGLDLQAVDGVVTGVGPVDGAPGRGPWLSTTCEVRPGFSGGPLVWDGRLIGLVIGGRRTAGVDRGPALAVLPDAIAEAWRALPAGPRWSTSAELRRDADLPALATPPVSP